VINENTELGEFNPDRGFKLTGAYVDDDDNEGKNFVHIIDKDMVEQLKKAYEDNKEDDEQWLYHFLTDNKINFPGHKEIKDFTSRVMDEIVIFEEDSWDNYIKFTLCNSENKSIFNIDLSPIGDLDEVDLPLPYEAFRKLFLAIKNRMPKIIWMFIDEQPKEEEQEEEKKTTESPIINKEEPDEEMTKEKYSRLKEFRRKKKKIKNKITSIQG
jgi:hypothetical protein